MHFSSPPCWSTESAPNARHPSRQNDRMATQSMSQKRGWHGSAAPNRMEHILFNISFARKWHAHKKVAKPFRLAWLHFLKVIMRRWDPRMAATRYSKFNHFYFHLGARLLLNIIIYTLYIDFKNLNKAIEQNRIITLETVESNACKQKHPWGKQGHYTPE